MTGVFLSVHKEDKEMRVVFPEILYRNLAVTGPDEIFVCDIVDKPPKRLDHAVIVFKEKTKPACSFPAGEHTVAVVDSCGGGELLERVSETMLPAITCGLSARDTLTLSSIRTDSAVVTLQRSLACFDGSIAEPQEIPLRMWLPLDNFTLMATAAVFLLTGNANCLKNAQLTAGNVQAGSKQFPVI